MSQPRFEIPAPYQTILEGENRLSQLMQAHSPLYIGLTRPFLNFGQVEIVSSRVKEDEAKANIQAEAATALKEECEADLALAIPVLEGILLCLGIALLGEHNFSFSPPPKNDAELIKFIHGKFSFCIGEFYKR